MHVVTLWKSAEIVIRIKKLKHGIGFGCYL
eukprot:COSAG02_NODE_37874_length_436_cov_0.946588_1_plen_29_part_01